MAADAGWLTFRMPLEFTDDPAAFLDATRDHLAADPVQTTVIATVGSRSRESGGSGLGLSICRAIVEAHGGFIDAADSALGGLSITLTLPLGNA